MELRLKLHLIFYNSETNDKITSFQKVGIHIKSKTTLYGAVYKIPQNSY